MTDRREHPRAARWARQLVLPAWGAAGQARLQAQRVLVVGCGGLGAPVLAQLASAGVGHLTLVDDDHVEPSNLNRQWLFAADDVGRAKADAAAAALARLDPDIVVDARVERVTAARARALVAAHDVVVDCSDGLPTKYLLNDACVREDRPLVHGAATAWSGQVFVVAGARGPCLRCVFPTLPPRGSMPTCRDAGIAAPVTGVVGSWQAAEVLQLLLRERGGRGEQPALVGRFMSLDVRRAATRTIEVARDPECPACGDAPTCDARRDSDYELPPCDVEGAGDDDD